jgi:hypothetical protein
MISCLPRAPIAKAMKPLCVVCHDDKTVDQTYRKTSLVRFYVARNWEALRHDIVGRYVVYCNHCHWVYLVPI